MTNNQTSVQVTDPTHWIGEEIAVQMGSPPHVVVMVGELRAITDRYVVVMTMMAPNKPDELAPRTHVVPWHNVVDLVGPTMHELPEGVSFSEPYEPFEPGRPGKGER